MGQRSKSKDLPRCGPRQKVCYPTQGAAIHRALIRSKHSGTPLRIYRCPACSSYHLTSQARRSAA